MEEKKKKILVIEDAEFIRLGVKQILERKNYSVLMTESGEEGLDLVLKEKPDLILCDILLPGKNGYEVKQELDSMDETSVIPFIFLTAKSELKDIRKGMELGADDYISKPFGAKELINAVDTRLKRTELFKNHKNNEVIDNGKKKHKLDDKILLTENKKSILVQIKDIIQIKAEGVYTKIFLSEDRKMLVRKLLGEWEEILPEKYFMRIHKSYIINLEYVESVSGPSNSRYILKLKKCEKPVIASKTYSKLIEKKFRV